MLRNLVEYGFLFGVLFFVALVPMTKIALGAVLTVLGAFLPASMSDRLLPRSNKATISILGTKLSLNGSLRLGVIFAGIMIIATSAGDVHDAYSSLSKKAKEDAWTSVCAGVIEAAPWLKLDEFADCEPLESGPARP